MLLELVSAALIALVANQEFSRRRDPSLASEDFTQDVITPEQVKESFAGSPYAYYPKGEPYEHLIDAGIPKFPQQQANVTYRDIQGNIQAREPNAAQSKLINKEDRAEWQNYAGRNCSEPFFSGAMNYDLLRDKWETDDWCVHPNILPNRLTPLYLQFSGKTRNPRPKINGGVIIF